MPRHNRGRSRSQAQKEKRQGVIQAWRMFDGSVSERIAGTIHELERDHSLPRLSDVHNSHKLFIINPRTVRQQLGRGFDVGFNVRGAMEDARSDVKDRRHPRVKIEEIDVSGSRNKRYIIARLAGAEVLKERERAYTMLGEYGVRGFQSGRQVKHACGRLDIVLAKTTAPMIPEQKLGYRPKGDEQYCASQEGIIEAVTDAFVVHGLMDEEIELSKLYTDVNNIR